MTSEIEHDFYDFDALVERLTKGVMESGREVVFVVGAPLTAASGPNTDGVFDVAGVTELIRSQFNSQPGQLAILDQKLGSSENKYQEAFKFLIGRRGQDAANTLDTLGSIYGNVGRCLQFMGRQRDALYCYHKSARVLEGDNTADRYSNRAYAREWIGEIFEEANVFELATAFYVDALDYLRMFAPGRAAKVRIAIKRVEALSDQRPMQFGTARRLVERWIRTDLKYSQI